MRSSEIWLRKLKLRLRDKRFANHKAPCTAIWQQPLPSILALWGFSTTDLFLYNYKNAVLMPSERQKNKYMFCTELNPVSDLSGAHCKEIAGLPLPKFPIISRWGISQPSWITIHVHRFTNIVKQWKRSPIAYIVELNYTDWLILILRLFTKKITWNWLRLCKSFHFL